MDALDRSLAAGTRVGSVAIIVDAKDEKGAAFYEKFRKFHKITVLRSTRPCRLAMKFQVAPVVDAALGSVPSSAFQSCGSGVEAALRPMFGSDYPRS
jgi:hypothetical protein